MDGQRFDDLTRVLSLSLNRKRFLVAIGGLLSAGSAAGLHDQVAAKKRGKKRKGRGGVTAQGGACGATCTTSADCAECPTGRCTLTGVDESLACATLCEGIVCNTDQQCVDAISEDCVCRASNCACFDGNCGPPCGSECVDDGDCTGCPFGACVDGTCLSSCPVSCEIDADCAGINPDCVCDDGNNCDCPNGCGDTCPGRCGGVEDCGPGCFCSDSVCDACAGEYIKDEECAGFPECVCNVATGQCGGATCAGECTKDPECPNLAGCFCNLETNQCETDVCPGLCESNPDCEEQGADNCVCFLGAGVDVASAEEVAAEGVNGGTCGECLGAGVACDASTECCGQLVCAGGSCRRKRKPKVRRCNKHGQGCRGDNDCCAQALCYKGKCGEKDTHCNNEGECAQGYHCQGGPLAPGHRRCRKSGRHKRNKTRRKNG